MAEKLLMAGHGRRADRLTAAAAALAAAAPRHASLHRDRFVVAPLKPLTPSTAAAHPGSEEPLREAHRSLALLLGLARAPTGAFFSPLIRSSCQEWGTFCKAVYAHARTHTLPLYPSLLPT